MTILPTSLILRDVVVLEYPFRHIVARFGNEHFLQKVVEEFPAPTWPGWYTHKNPHALKKASRGVLTGEYTQALNHMLSEQQFLESLQYELQIERPLLSDPEREGGGLHFIEPGGYLDMHTDFNYHPRSNLDRRVNLLLYLNRDWKREHGGLLELGVKRDVKYPPEFGLMVIFPTRDDTLHGHPVPVTRERRSFALYYYSDGRPESEKRDPHSTLYKKI